METTLHSKVLDWVLADYKSTNTPKFIGINGSQGIGKSTLSSQLVESLKLNSISAVSISIDDFYLTHQKQLELAQNHPDNLYLQKRGYPGTHDIDLGNQIFESLAKFNSPIKIPRYNKSAFNGLGDRFETNQWSLLSTPSEIIFIDGWMLGYTEVHPSILPNSHFAIINEKLNLYKSWYQYINDFIFLDPENIEYVFDWRIEAEEKMKAQGKDGMSRIDIENYLKTFIPAYETYLPNLRAQSPFPGRTLHFKIGKNRQPIK